ncbi:PPOX class F420-dependent oxidoreductase [Fodinicola feengrottensis]|uniref:PPOX class F420-dependent oxidoreductase n=1 Tax=Fodinicola feengrottensis TaxID=435914 RepID=A0ABP4UCN5_9ACTN|nr:PPOX class F420-dependent oxidoreductase [Fodinicola feengrottensis]
MTLAAFQRQKTVLLRTRKRDGTWVGTPVNIAVEGELAYIRTYEKAWKSKRLRNFPDVQVCASTVRGVPTGPYVLARARLLAGSEAKAAARRLARKHPLLHGVGVPMAHKLMRTRTLHYELSSTCR